MKFLPSFIIYSLDRPNDPYIIKGDSDDPEWHSHSPVNGYYKGEHELSYSAPLCDINKVRKIATLRDQESILVVENGVAYLEYPAITRTGLVIDNCKPREYIGQWAEVSNVEAERLESYTEYNGKYFCAVL